MIKLSKISAFTFCNIQTKRTVTQSVMKTHKVFVYGTLKTNEPNHHWLTHPDNGKATLISEGTTKNKYPLVIATRYNIPFLLYSPGNGHNVQGEIYEIDDKMLSQLDKLEDHPKYYNRELDDIIGTKGDKNEKSVMTCWVYFLKNFRPEMMLKTHFESYSTKGSHGLVYMERFNRDDSYDYYSEIKANNNESTIDDLDETEFDVPLA